MHQHNLKSTPSLRESMRFNYKLKYFLLSLSLVTWAILDASKVEADLFVSSQDNESVLRYKASTERFVGVAASGGGLADPLGLTIGPDGDLYVASGSSDQILHYNGKTGAFMDVFASDGLDGPANLVFGPDGNLYVSSSGSGQILRYDGK